MAEDLEKLLLDPENFRRDGIDLENLPLEQVFEQLRTSKEGLSDEDAEERLNIFGPNKLEEKRGAITKRMTAIEEMAGMDVLCCDKTGTLTLNRLTIDRNLIEVFQKYMDKDMVVLLAARASRLENQDAVDAEVINMLADPKEAHANIREVHFLPFNPVDKRTAITYIDSDGKWYRASKGAPEQILTLCQEKQQIAAKLHVIIDMFAERGLRSLAVSFQVTSWPLQRKQAEDLAWERICTPHLRCLVVRRMKL